MFSNYKMEMFNRWGNLVFITKNADIRWDTLKINYKLLMCIDWVLQYKDNLTGQNVRSTGL